jgi:hypothetical protein
MSGIGSGPYQISGFGIGDIELSVSSTGQTAKGSKRNSLTVLDNKMCLAVQQVIFMGLD